MSHLGFGGVSHGKSLIFGAPFGPLEQALPCCTHAHGALASGSLLGSFLDHAHAGDDGWPTYQGWPRHDTQIHQQMYVDWIKRAHASGLRVMIASAVNSEVLGSLFHGSATDVTDHTAIEAQIDATKAMIRRERSWMHLALSPGEARAAAESGKLAVLLGVEVDSPLGGRARRDGDYDAVMAERVLTRWHRKGVRLVTPIHLADSALGGCALFDDRFALGSHHLHRIYSPSARAEDDWPDIDARASTAELRGVEFLAGGSPEASSLAALYGHGFPGYRSIRRDGHVNARGLSSGGQDFLLRMMRKGMLLDVDHMSQHAVDAAITLGETHGYPLVCSHTRLRALAVPRPADKDWVRGVADEGMRTDAQLARLGRLGSLFGIITHLGPVRGIGTRTSVRTRSYDTSESFALAWMHAVGDLGLSNVAIGTDFNGFYGQPGPRFSRGNQNAAPEPMTDEPRPVRYGQDLVPRMQRAIDRSLVGRRSYDLNVDGLAHYGMLPDFLVDVATQVGGWPALAPFFRSAQAVFDTWARCIERGRGIAP